jgi:hypothetical protein
LRELQVYLGDCNGCSNYQLNYEIGWLPLYSLVSTISSGLNIYIQFNQPVKVANSTDLREAFLFTIDKLPDFKGNETLFVN